MHASKKIQFMKKLPLITFLTIFLLNTLYSQHLISNPSQSSHIISNFNHLDSQQLLDTANFYFFRNSYDTAKICYSFIINTPIKDHDVEQHKRIIEALNRSAIINGIMCDYRGAHELLIRALLLCETYHHEEFIPVIYNNLGNVYQRLKILDIAKTYFLNAMNSCSDSVLIVALLNNIGLIEMDKGVIDSAFYFLNRSLQVSKQYDNIHLDVILNTMAQAYQKNKQYDSAFYYFQWSLEEARKNNKIEMEADNLSKLGYNFFETNKPDLAIHYISLSNTLAEENSFLEILAQNYFTLSEIEEANGYPVKALDFFKTYANLKDSVFNIQNFESISQMQRLYEVSKTNQQIEELVTDQRIKEQKIHYQRIIQLITLVVLSLVCIVLVIILIQKRQLNKTYKILFEKNLEIINLQENSLKNHHEKYKKIILSNNLQSELLDKILSVMEDTSIICDAKFSLEKLVDHTQSNSKYVSQVINDTFKKNFRSFLSSYRIREAQRLFSEPGAEKYTVESVALQVGFKSRFSFNEAFKDITGVSPGFYVKSIKEQNNT